MGTIPSVFAISVRVEFGGVQIRLDRTLCRFNVLFPPVVTICFPGRLVGLILFRLGMMRGPLASNVAMDLTQVLLQPTETYTASATWTNCCERSLYRR